MIKLLRNHNVTILELIVDARTLAPMATDTMAYNTETQSHAGMIRFTLLT